MAKLNVADQFVQVLVQAGAQRIYGVVRDGLNPVVDAICRTPGIDWVHVRNEEAGAFAAAAEAQLIEDGWIVAQTIHYTVEQK